MFLRGVSYMLRAWSHNIVFFHLNIYEMDELQFEKLYSTTFFFLHLLYWSDESAYINSCENC